MDELTYEIVGAAIEVHKIMGRGLLESIYHKCMIEELKHKRISFSTELRVPVIYKQKELDMDFRCDLFVKNCLVVELKSAKELLNLAYEAKLLTYMKLLKAPKGILINFNCSNIFGEWQKTYVNGYFKNLKS